MATVAANPSQAAAPPSGADRRAVAGGLLWAFFVLVLLTAWLWAKFWEGDSWPVVVVSGVLAVAALALSAWQFRTPAGPEAALRQRKTLGRVLLAARVVTRLAAVWLTVHAGWSDLSQAS